MLMIIEDNKIGQLLIVKPMEKRLDADTSREFKERMGVLIKSGEDQLLLNLAEVQFIDSSGLGTLLSILRNLGEKGSLILCGINENVMTLFRLTRINRVFEIYGGEAEAIAAIMI
jgi:anti-sigma B factor antagonist